MESKAPFEERKLIVRRRADALRAENLRLMNLGNEIRLELRRIRGDLERLGGSASQALRDRERQLLRDLAANDAAEERNEAERTEVEEEMDWIWDQAPPPAGLDRVQ